MAAGLVGTGAVITFGHGQRSPDPEPACPLKELERREYAIVAALADALFPPGNPIGLSGTEARVPEYVDRWMHGLQPDRATDFRGMLLVFEHGTLAFGLRVRRFTELPQAARERYLHRWETARVYSRRMLSTALKTSLGVGYFAYPGVQKRLGIVRTCVTPADAEPRAEWA